MEKKRKPSPVSRLMKNMAVSASLVLCVVALRAGAVPRLQAPVDAVLTAVTGDSLLDDRLGKLSFVSNMFPETVLVFGEKREETLALPVSGGSLTHPWSSHEPYTAWQSEERQVRSALEGEVTDVARGVGQEWLVEVTSGNGLCCIHGSMETCAVRLGDWVQQGQVLGTLLPGESLAFEVKRQGISVDPVPLLATLP